MKHKILITKADSNDWYQNDIGKFHEAKIRTDGDYETEGLIIKQSDGEIITPDIPHSSLDAKKKD